MIIRFRRKDLKPHPELTGYIAFLILIFFMIFISMNTSKRIPPRVAFFLDNDIRSVNAMKSRNVLRLKLNRDNRLTADGEVISINQLKNIAKDFIDNPENEQDKPEKVECDIPFFGPMSVTAHHVISFEYDKRSTYGAYISVRNELNKAYNELRDDLARKKWEKKYVNLLPDEQKAVQQVYSQQISEKVY